MVISLADAVGARHCCDEAGRLSLSGVFVLVEPEEALGALVGGGGVAENC